MPRRSSSYRTPHEWLVEGEWPTGVFDSETPEVVAYAVEIAKLLAVAVKGQNKSKIAAEAEVDRATLYALLSGSTWADMITLGKLEAVLGQRLWPDRPAELRRASPGRNAS